MKQPRFKISDFSPVKSVSLEEIKTPDTLSNCLTKLDKIFHDALFDSSPKQYFEIAAKKHNIRLPDTRCTGCGALNWHKKEELYCCDYCGSNWGYVEPVKKYNGPLPKVWHESLMGSIRFNNPSATGFIIPEL